MCLGTQPDRSISKAKWERHDANWIAESGFFHTLGRWQWEQRVSPAESTIICFYARSRWVRRIV
jgi:hypothetical protein